MEVQIKNLSDLKENPSNPKVHNEKQLDFLMNSIEQFGFNNPVLINKNNVIISGHGRYKALKEMGIDEVPCIQLDLSEEDAKMFGISDNQTNLETGWDYTKLNEEMIKLHSTEYNMGDFGFGFSLEPDNSGHEEDDMPPMDSERRRKNSNTSTKLKQGTTAKTCTCPDCGHKFIPPKKDNSMKVDSSVDTELDKALEEFLTQ